jgi:thiol-disulfide isomerase/thioredoxin
MSLVRFFAPVLVGTAVAIAAAGERVTLEGQVVCSECWGEEDRNEVPYGSKFDLQCAKTCANDGIPRALAVREQGQFVLYTLRPGSYDPGPQPFLELVPHRARVTGIATTENGKRMLAVESVERLDRAVAAPEAPGFAPELELQTLTGAPQKLSALRGQIVVLNFWATYCPPCLREMPMLSKVSTEYLPLGVQVVGVATEGYEKRAAIRQILRTHRASYLQWVGATTQQMNAMGLGTALPATALIGRDGKIAARLIGELTEDALRRELDALLDQEH